MVISERSVRPLSWLNTPPTFSRRMWLEEYRVAAGLKKQVTRRFAEEVGSNGLVCWLKTDSGGALFIDEENCNRKVYHVANNDFSDYRLLDDPETALDRYLEHYFATGSSKRFDFRA